MTMKILCLNSGTSLASEAAQEMGLGPVFDKKKIKKKRARRLQCLWGGLISHLIDVRRQLYLAGYADQDEVWHERY